MNAPDFIENNIKKLKENLTLSQRQKQGAFYTNEDLIMKVINPCIITPIMNEIGKVKSMRGLKKTLEYIKGLKILDPACGYGNFLCIAYREIMNIEREISRVFNIEIKHGFSCENLYGIDINETAISVAKSTLIKATSEYNIGWTLFDNHINLDNNLIKGDALFVDWEEVDIIIGNPPYMGGTKMTETLGKQYKKLIKKAFPNISGCSDLCTYFFRKAHNSSAKTVGFIGTTTIKQGVSRAASLDYIINNGGTIIDAISKTKWEGDANVTVSIVNWIKEDTKKVNLNGNVFKGKITSNLEKFVAGEDYTAAKELNFEVALGVKLGHSIFVLTKNEYNRLLEEAPKNKEVLQQFVKGSTLISPYLEKEYCINFTGLTQKQAAEYKSLYKRIENSDRASKKNWWLFTGDNKQLKEEINKNTHYIGIAVASKYVIPIRVSSEILPVSIKVIPTSDPYIYGVVNSTFFRKWVLKQCTRREEAICFINRCYTTFPFPVNPAEDDKTRVGKIALELDDYRYQYSIKHRVSYTELYNKELSDPASGLYKIKERLDTAVLNCYDGKHHRGLIERPEKTLLMINKIR